jgi:hypothetical protein
MVLTPHFGPAVVWRKVFVIHVHPVHTGAEGIDGEDVIV